MSAITLAQINQEDRRLVLLRTLKEDGDYTVNSSILQSALEYYGHKVSREKIHADIAWLAESELVTYTVLQSIKVVKLTRRGLDVCEGTVQVVGVKRPSPSSM